MKLTIMGTKTDLIRMVQPMLALQDECKFLVHKNGIICKVVDPAHVSMCEVNIHKDYFREFKITSSKKMKLGDEYEIGVDLEKLVESLSMSTMQCSDEATIEFNTNDNKAHLTMHTNGIFLDHPFYQVDTTGMSDPKVPELTLPFMFEIKSQKTLRKIIKDVSKFSDHLTIHRNPDEPNKLFIEFDDCHDLECSFTLTDQLATTLECKDAKEEIKSLYPIEYLDFILTGLSKAFYGDVTIQCFMGNDYPIKITAGKKPYEVLYLLAPRIESE